MEPTLHQGQQQPGASDYNRLQQELIAVRTQRDRQIGQLMRLNRLSDALLVDLGLAGVADTFAEAIVDVLDIGIGALWLFDDDLPASARFAVCGMAVPWSAWASAGTELLARLPAAQPRISQRLTQEQASLLFGLQLEDGLACRCIARDGRCRGLLMAANSRSLAGMAEPVWQESLEVLSLLAEKLAAHLDQWADRRVIASQMQQLQASEQRLSAVLKGTNDGWWDLDLSTGRCFLSARWRQMVGETSSRQEVEETFWRDRIHPAERERFDWLFDQIISGRSEILETELRLRCHDGQFLPVLIRGTVIRLGDGTPQRFSGSMQDLSERRRHEAQVHRLAFYDSLTDLPNRRLLQQRVAQVLRDRERTESGFALLMLDLDHFKTLNDSHGHAAGDQLLCVVSQRLQNCLRPADMVARLGGDEFVVLLQNLDTDSTAAEAATRQHANKLIMAIAEPIPLDFGTVHQSVSVGIALSEARGSTFERLMQQADLALYEAKGSGRNKVMLFQPDMQRRIDQRSRLEARLREAINTSTLSHAYQLQVNADRQPVGCEALIRWRAEGGPMVPPAEFLPVAQESGLIHRLGQQLTRGVVTDVLAWETMGLPDHFRIAINFSTPEFLRSDFAETVIELLATTGLSGRRLLFEITEDCVLSDLALAADRMHQLMDYQIEFSLDDFGTGYSSFSYLRYLPVHEVKIDQGFVRRFLHQPQDAAIVRAILELGRSLNLRVVAEGVETEVQWRALRDEGCSRYQGWLFDRPCLESQTPLLDRLASFATDVR